MTRLQKQQELAVHRGFVRQFELMIETLRTVGTLRTHMTVHQMEVRMERHRRAAARLERELAETDNERCR